MEINIIWALAIVLSGIALISFGVVLPGTAVDEVRRQRRLTVKWIVFMDHVLDYREPFANGPQLIMLGFVCSLVGLASALALFVK